MNRCVGEATTEETQSQINGQDEHRIQPIRFPVSEVIVLLLQHALILVMRRPSYMIERGICYLTLTDKSYPKRLAFLFLEEINREFEADLKAEYGDE
jgi:hypothetical protein